MTEETDTEEVTVAMVQEGGPQIVSHQTLGIHEAHDQVVEIEPNPDLITVSATQKPEDVVKELMSEEKKQELMARLQALKSSLNLLEQQKQQFAETQTQEREEEEEELKVDGEILFNRVELLTKLNADLRANISTFTQSDRYDAFRESLELLAKSNKIYDKILQQLLK